MSEEWNFRIGDGWLIDCGATLAPTVITVLKVDGARDSYTVHVAAHGYMDVLNLTARGIANKLAAYGDAIVPLPYHSENDGLERVMTPDAWQCNLQAVKALAHCRLPSPESRRVLALRMRAAHNHTAALYTFAAKSPGKIQDTVNAYADACRLALAAALQQETEGQA